MYAGKSERLVDKLKSFLAQFEFAYQVHEWEAKGIPFSTYLYVPELHPETQMHFCEHNYHKVALRRLIFSR